MWHKREYQRELLFTAEAPETPVQTFRRRRVGEGEPRTWKTAYDIPRCTVVLSATGTSHLYITSRGTGWWLDPNSQGKFTEIPVVEESTSGWKLSSSMSIDGRGPYREVLDDSASTSGRFALLFLTEVPEVSPKLLTPQVWGSVYDIPRRTLVRPDRGSSLLYVTSTGMGWWVLPGEYRSEVSYVENGDRGWRLDFDAESRGPFVEVPM